MGRWLYDNAMYRFDTPEPSYWESTPDDQIEHSAPLATTESCDVAIIGGGYTGLSAALHLSRDTQLDVRLLEAGHIGWGASGRNGGFCSIGGDALGAEAMVKRYGIDQTQAYYRSQVDAIGLVRDLIDDEEIDCPMQGDGEVAIACSPRGFAAFKKHAEFQYRVLGLDTAVLTREAFAERYFDTPLQHGGVILRPTFGLHPLRFVRGLAGAATKYGAQLHPLSEVIGWVKDGGDHVLTTTGGTLRAKQVIVATNGFAPEHLHRQLRGRSLPVISSIVVTRPMSAADLALQQWQTESPAITAVKLLNYFRLLPDGRFLFGGRGSADGSPRSAVKNYAALIARFHELFPNWRDIEIEYRWHGLVCMTRRATPAIGRFPDDLSVFFAFGYHGNGVNTATWSGQQVARWLGSSKTASVATPEWLPEMVRDMPGRFPLSPLRLAYLQVIIGGLRLMQRLQTQQ